MTRKYPKYLKPQKVLAGLTAIKSLKYFSICKGFICKYFQRFRRMWGGGHNLLGTQCHVIIPTTCKHQPPARVDILVIKVNCIHPPSFNEVNSVPNFLWIREQQGRTVFLRLETWERNSNLKHLKAKISTFDTWPPVSYLSSFFLK